MTEYELLDLLGDNRALIADTWELFLGVHMAIVGVLFFAADGRFGPVGRMALLPVYYGFMFLNWGAQVDNYTYSAALLGQIADVQGTNQWGEAVFDALAMPQRLFAIFAVSAVIGTSLLVFGGTRFDPLTTLRAKLLGTRPGPRENAPT